MYASGCILLTLVMFISDISRFLFDIYCFHSHLTGPLTFCEVSRAGFIIPILEIQKVGPCNRHLLLLLAQPPPLLLILPSPFPLGNISSHITFGFDEALIKAHCYSCLYHYYLPKLQESWLRKANETPCLLEIWIKQRTSRQKAVGIKGQPTMSTAKIPGVTDAVAQISLSSFTLPISS